MSTRCWGCGGTGKKDRLLFGGQKRCHWCDGTGQQDDLGDLARDARMSYQDMAENYMDRIDPDYDWGGDFEDGYQVPGEAAERWAHGPGPHWDEP